MAVFRFINFRSLSTSLSFGGLMAAMWADWLHFWCLAVLLESTSIMLGNLLSLFPLEEYLFSVHRTSSFLVYSFILMACILVTSWEGSMRDKYFKDLCVWLCFNLHVTQFSYRILISQHCRWEIEICFQNYGHFCLPLEVKILSPVLWDFTVIVSLYIHYTLLAHDISLVFVCPFHSIPFHSIFFCVCVFSFWIPVFWMLTLIDFCSNLLIFFPPMFPVFSLVDYLNFNCKLSLKLFSSESIWLI